LNDTLDQVAGTGYSLKLFLEWAAQKRQSIFKSPRKYTSLLISHTLSSISHN
jgi:hypothetical protein